MYGKQEALLFPGQIHTPAAGTHTIQLDGTGTAQVYATTDAQKSDTLQPALLYFGGNAEDAATSYPTLKKAYPQHAIYIMHYRGYAPSTGRANEETMLSDASKLYQHAAQLHSAIAVVGRSLGTGIACYLAGNETMTQLILVTPYDSMVHVARLRYPYLPVHWLLNNRFESWRYVPQITAPTLIIQAELDETIPPECTRDLFTHFQAQDGTAKAQYVKIKGAMHNTILEHPNYVTLLRGDTPALTDTPAPAEENTAAVAEYAA